MAGISKHHKDQDKETRRKIAAIGSVADPTNPFNISTLERQMLALEMRKAGATFQAIAERIGYSSAGMAKSAVMSAIERIQAENVDELRAMEVERLNHLQLKWWNLAQTGGADAIKATDMILKIIDRRARLFGLYQPETVQQNNIIEIRNVDDWRKEIASDADVKSLPEHTDGEFLSEDHTSIQSQLIDQDPDFYSHNQSDIVEMDNE